MDFISSILRRNKRNGDALKIGVVTNGFFAPIHSGFNRRLADLLENLHAMGYQVHLVVIDQPYFWRKFFVKNKVADVDFVISPSRNVFYFGIRLLYWFSVDLIWWIFRANLDGIFTNMLARYGCADACKVDYWNVASPRSSNKIGKIARRCGWQAIIVEYIWLHHLVDELPENVIRILDAIDVMYLRHQRLRALNLHSQFAISKQKEIELLRKFDCVIAIQDREREIFHDLKKQGDCIFDILTVGVSCDHYPCSEKYNGNQHEKEFIVMFVGGMNAFNADGICRFVSEQWPWLYKENKKWSLYIYGGVCSAIDKECRNNGVRLFGVVGDITQYYRNADIIINPIWSGTGLKIKTIEALAHGKPLVSTEAGVEGLPGKLDNVCFVAENENEFRWMLQQLMGSISLRAALSLAAKSYSERHFSASNTYSELEEYLSKNSENVC